MRDFKQKSAFVTGGASGIGLAMAREFLGAGMNVTIADIETTALDRAIAELGHGPDRLRGVQCDTASRAAVAAARDAAIASFGNIHLLCNNAGVGNGGRIEQVAPAAWEWLLGVNLMGVVHGLTECLPHMKSHGEDGHIVNTGSMAGMGGFQGMGPYCASKAAVVSLSESLARELVDSRLGVSVLCPGAVGTAFGYSRRNAPSAVPPPPPNSRDAQETGASTDRLMTIGKPPAEIAARVMQAIRDRDLYIFTHPEMRVQVDDRYQAISAAFDKAAAFDTSKL